MFSKILKLYISLKRIKFRFDFPKKNKLLLFDNSHNLILKKIIKREFNILYLRDDKQIYFWIYLKQIIFFDFRFETYTKNYIKFTSPKVIITFNDARYQLYKLKKTFKKIYFISVVNGVRLDHWFKKREKIWPKNLKCDYFFVLNKHYISKYQNLVKSNYIPHGHFRNNLIKIKKTKFRNEFLYLSQVYDSGKTGIDHEDFEHYKKIFSFLNLFLNKNKKKIHILLRRNKKNPRQSIEIDFYKKIFKSNCIFHQSNKWQKKYKILDEFENILFSTSTMGYEAIGRKKKIACLGPPKSYRNSKNYFGWPSQNSKKYNFFSIKEVNYKEVERVMENIMRCSQNKWNKKYYPIVKDQSYFDSDNYKLRNTILHLIKT